MAKILCQGSCIKCSLGTIVTEIRLLYIKANSEDKGIAVVTDALPTVNIVPFGVCATTQTACIPMTTMWLNGSASVKVNGVSAILDSSVLPCTVGGVISVVSSAQESVVTSSRGAS